MTADADAVRARALRDSGESVAKIAEILGKSRASVYRWLNAGPAAAPASAGVLKAVSALAERVEEAGEGPLDATAAVRLTIARAVAARLDQCAVATSGTSALAVGALSRELRATLDELESEIPREPDSIDLLRAERMVRLAAVGVDPTVGGTAPRIPRVHGQGFHSNNGNGGTE